MVSSLDHLPSLAMATTKGALPLHPFPPGGGHFLLEEVYGAIHDWATTFGTKELRTMSHWISAFIMIYYYLINKF